MNNRMLTVAAFATSCALIAGCTRAPLAEITRSDIIELDAIELGARLADGSLSAEQVLEAYLARIAAIDDSGPMLNAIIEINPDALQIARQLDAAFARSGPIGPLHGLPVVLKANIDTGDRMATSAGSLALADHRAPDDAAHVRRLREAGAVIIAKANLSEWANFRSDNSISGWSSLGGQTHNAYVLDRNPCGSSSGSAVAVAARLAPFAIGTETDGSIVCPSAHNGVVGIKPTTGLIEQDGIIPIAASQDTAGPIARTVADAAMLLAALATPNLAKEYSARDAASLSGIRIGIVRDYAGAGDYRRIDRAFSDAVAGIARAGATMVDPIRLDIPARARQAELEVLLYEFNAGLNAYLQQAGAPLASLDELIDFNADNAPSVMPYFGQDLFLQAQQRDSLETQAYRDAVLDSGDYMREVLDRIFAANDLDALIAPSNGPAWKTDIVYGDRFSIGSSSYAAVSGYPSLTVPAALIAELPVGISIIGRPYDEARLIQIAAAFEDLRGEFPEPQFLETLEVDLGND